MDKTQEAILTVLGALDAASYTQLLSGACNRPGARFDAVPAALVGLIKQERVIVDLGKYKLNEREIS